MAAVLARKRQAMELSLEALVSHELLSRNMRFLKECQFLAYVYELQLAPRLIASIRPAISLDL